MAGAATVAVLALLTACLDSIVRELEPDNQQELVNEPDSLRFTAVDLRNVNDKEIFTWTNTGTRASVLHRTFIHHGYGILVIEDATGVQVDSTILQYELDTETREGTPGEWTVTLVLANARGRVDFTLLGEP
jgi:hypothetical protein